MTPHARARTARRLLVSTTAAALLLAVAAPAGAAPTAATPSITSLTLSKSTVPHSGGSVTLKAKVKKASSCKISSSVSISGLPKTVGCSSGKVSKTFTVKTAPSQAARHITFTLKATKSGHSKTKTIKLTQSAEPAPAKPTVGNFTVSPASVASSGGNVTLTATIAHGSSCTLSVSPALTGLPEATSCTGTSYNESVALPEDDTTTANSYVFTFAITGAGGTVTASNHPMTTVAGASGGGGPTAISAFSASAGAQPINGMTGDTEDAELLSVSCPAAAECVAVGDYRANAATVGTSDQEGLVETLSGTTWTPAALPDPTDNYADPTIAPVSVSCWSVGNCVVVGSYVASNGGYEPYVATMTDGGAWTWQMATMPGPAGSTTRTSGLLVDVSCGTAGSCFAVGNSEPYGGEHDAIIEAPTSSVDSAWAGSLAPLPTDADAELSNGTEISDYLNDVSCVSATACSAVGNYTTGPSNELSGAEVGDYYNGTAWTATQLSPTADSGVGDSIACAGTDCVGSGEFDSSYANIEPEESGAWDAPIAAPSMTNDGSGLEAASCAPATGVPSCVVVGTYYPAGSSSASDPLIDAGSGDSYTDTTPELPSTAHANGMAVLEGVSCAAAGSCGAIGYYSATDEVNSRDDGLIEIEGSSGWTATEAPNPPDVYDPLALSSISCVANWGCAIVGRYQSTADNVVPDIVMAPLGS